MEKVTFTNSRGEVIVFDDFPYKFLSLDGLGGLGASIQTQKAPFQDGSTLVDVTLGERDPVLTFALKADVPADLSKIRAELSRVFNPKLGLGVLRYETDGIAKEIYAVPSSAPFFPTGSSNQTSTLQKGSIELDCPNPYWLDEEQVDQLVVWEGGLEFPLQLPTEFATQSTDKAKILLNDGDDDTPIQVTFNGPATSPIQIINKTTGEFLKVNQSLVSGERLEINTAFGQKKVVKVAADGTETNAFHFITLDSTFLQLQIGNNLIDYSTGADYERAGVTIKWRNRYVGI